MTDRNVVIRLRGDVSDFQAKMVAAGRSVGGVVDKMTDGEKQSRKFRDGLTSVGDAGGRIGLGAAAALTGIVAVTANFEQKMSGVQAATHESAEAMGELRDAAIEAGARTAFSASEAAEGIENLAKAGVATADILGGGLDGALDLAAAGTVDVAFAAETAATAMTQFGLSGEQVPHIADLLAAAAGKAQGEVSDMAYALRQSGLVANQVGLSIEETTAGLAAFASQGLLGSDAGTSFKTMLSSLTPSTEKAATAMESIGLQAYDANGSFIGLEAVAGQLRKGLADLTDEQKQSTLETIFGSDAVRAATVLYDQGERGIRDWIDAVDDQGFAAETAAIKLDNLKGDFEALKGSLETAFINMGSGSQGGLRGLTQDATDAVNAFNNLPPAMQGTVTQMLAITAITGGGLWFGSKVIKGIADTRDAIDNLSGSAGAAGRALRTAFTAGAILEGLNLIDDAIDQVFDRNLDNSQLNRSLDAFINGRVTGTLAETFGEDLTGFAEDLDNATSLVTIHSRALAKLPLIGDFASGGVNESIDNLKKMDEALARMVEAGEGDRAKIIFDRLAQAAQDAGYTTAEVADQFGQYETAVQNAADEGYVASVGFRSASRAIEDTDGATSGASRGLDDVARSADGAATAAEDLEAALGDLEVVLNARSKNRAYEASLDAIAERLKDRRDIIKEIQALQGEGLDGDRVSDANRDIADAQRDLAGAKTKTERESAADRLQSAKERLRDAQQAMGEDAERTNERIQDLREQLKDYKLTLNDGADAGREWNAMLDDIAKNALEAAQMIDPLDQPGFLNQARRNFIDLATEVTGSKEKAEDLADELGLIHRQKVKPQIDVDTKPAENDVRAFYRMLEGLKPVTVELFLDTTQANNVLEELGGRGGKTPLKLPGHRDGGYTGDYPIDAVAGIVHGREFVVNAEATARNRALLEAMNRGANGYQSSGYVQTTNNYSGADIDYDRLALAISRVRPMYGDVHMHGDLERFKRQLEADRQAAALSGRR